METNNTPPPADQRTEGSLQQVGSASPSRERKLYDALKTITKYQSPERLRKDAERLYGISGDDAIEMAYENVISQASAAIYGMRRPK